MFIFIEHSIPDADMYINKEKEVFISLGHSICDDKMLLVMPKKR